MGRYVFVVVSQPKKNNHVMIDSSVTVPFQGPVNLRNQRFAVQKGMLQNNFGICHSENTHYDTQ